MGGGDRLNLMLAQVQVFCPSPGPDPFSNKRYLDPAVLDTVESFDSALGSSFALSIGLNTISSMVLEVSIVSPLPNLERISSNRCCDAAESEFFFTACFIWWTASNERV